MRLKVPFFIQTNPLNCGPTALRMVLAYLDRDEGIEILEEKTGIRDGKGLSTIKMAIAASSLGYRTDFYSKHLFFNEENMKHEFYKKYSDINQEQSKKLVKEAKDSGVNVQEKTFSLKEILEFITKDSVPIILLDWNVVMCRKEKGFQGHFVPIVGFDRENIYVHNSGGNNSKEFMPVPRKIFDEARKSDGTDEDILVIYKKP